MGKQNDNSVSVKNPHNKTDVKKICLTNEIVDIGADSTNSKSLDFVNLCNENCEKIGDKNKKEIYKGFEKQGRFFFLF